MLVPAPEGVNEAGLLGHVTKGFRRYKALFLVLFSHRLKGPEDLG